MKLIFRLALLTPLIVLLSACTSSNGKLLPDSEPTHLSLQEFEDRMKGAWAGQVIGVTYGYPVEFKYNSAMVPDSVLLDWSDSLVLLTFQEAPGAYDDIYVDLTFVDTYRKNPGATSADYANAFGATTYDLWFANQVARNNIRNGLPPHACGHWRNNPECTSIDFQIEADFIGLLFPGMHREALALADSIGHLMAYGDGYYGGVFVSQMYAAAFTTSSIPEVIEKGLAPIPQESLFHQMITDVVQYYGAHPKDWKGCWTFINDKYQHENGSPFGAFDPWNIEASMNSCHVVTGLLYGNGDFAKSIEIATRCGNDADCNPGTVGGILGAIFGFEHIPAYFRDPLDLVDSLTFLGTNYTLEKAVQTTLDLALHNLGYESGDQIALRPSVAPICALEIAKPGFELEERRDHIEVDLSSQTFETSFKGNGIALFSHLTHQEYGSHPLSNDTLLLDAFVDGEFDQTIAFPTDFENRKFIAYYKYLEDGEHHLKLVPKNKIPGYRNDLFREVIYKSSNSDLPQ